MTLAPTAQEGVDKIKAGRFDLILLDLALPDASGMDTLARLREQGVDTPVFMITAYGSIEIAVEALKRGANDYFSKPWDNDKLIIEIDRMIAQHRLTEENRELKRALKQRYSLPNIVGKSERMLKMLDLVAQVAPSKATILITGETGTGKELIAKAIHASSPRADNAFVTVNTSSIPPELLDSTLFGAASGTASRKGSFETADRGTIFFDEIGAMSLETQAKLLRVVEEREFLPVGGQDTVRVDVRILAATNADLRRMVDEGKFRGDLYYRLNVIQIQVPPLRDRKEDVPVLIEHFVNRYCRENEKQFLVAFDADAMKVLLDHSWPGNVRELENTVESAVILATGPVVSTDVLPDQLLQASGMRIRRDESGSLPADASLFEKVADFERRVILEALDKTSFSQTEAAELLHVPLSTLNQKIKRLNIDVKRRGA